MKKIGIVTEYFFPHQGGVPEHVYFFSKELANWGYSVVIFTGDLGNKADVPLPRGVRLRKLGRSVPIMANGSMGKFTWGLDLGKQVKAVLEEEEIDLLHIHNPLDPTLPLLFLKYSKTVTVGTFHTYFKKNLFFNLLRKFAQKYLDKMEGAIVVSEACKEAMQMYFRGHFHVIPNGVDAQWFLGEKKKIPRFDDGYLNIFLMARLESRMHVGAVFDAFPYIQQEIPNSRIIVAGEGPLKRYYQKKAGSYLNDRIFFVGSVTYPEKLYYMATADVFCYPAQNHSFGIALLEAMASGVPVVATESPGFRVLIKNEVNGLLVDLRNPKALADGIIKIHSNKEFAGGLKSEGLKTASDFSWSKVTEQILKLYDEIFFKKKGVPFAA